MHFVRNRLEDYEPTNRLRILLRVDCGGSHWLPDTLLTDSQFRNHDRLDHIVAFTPLTE